MTITDFTLGNTDLWNINSGVNQEVYTITFRNLVQFFREWFLPRSKSEYKNAVLFKCEQTNTSKKLDGKRCSLNPSQYPLATYTTDKMVE